MTSGRMDLLALLLKKGDQLGLNNYRGRIILLNTGYKIFFLMYCMKVSNPT